MIAAVLKTVNRKGSGVRIPPSPLNFLNPQSLSGQRSFSTLNLRLVTTADAGCGGDKYGRLIAKDGPPHQGADMGSSPVRNSKSGIAASSYA